MFESSEPLTPEQIDFLNAFVDGQWDINPKTGLVDISGDFDANGLNGSIVSEDSRLRDFKGIRFGSVSGNFNCSDNFIRSLDGSPRTVEGNFVCLNNFLKTLEGGPDFVRGNFVCSMNSLETLEGSPSFVGGNFGCKGNELRDLKGSPPVVEGHFDCTGNAIQDLEGAPEVIKRGFHSDIIVFDKRAWGIPTFLEILEGDNEREKRIVQPLVDPKVLQQKIDQNPEKMAIELKSVMNKPEFQKLDLKWPGHLQSEVDLLGDLEGIGL